MPDITFLLPDGTEQGFEAPEGVSQAGTGALMRDNVKVTGTLLQGAARCTMSNGAVRPLAATCPSRPTC